MSDDDFSKRPFAAGTLTGLRAFRIDEFGRLRSPSYDSTIFRPGENIATCRRGSSASAWISALLPPSVLTGGGSGPGPDVAQKVEPVRHRPGAMDCSCGFYAYTNGSNEYHRSSRTYCSVEAVVEAYGLCTVGSAGFRAEKARLVAVVDPSRLMLGLRPWMAITIDVLFLAGVVLGLVMNLTAGHQIGSLINGVLAGLWAYFLGRDLGRRFALPWSDDLVRRFTAMRRLYPDVAIYPTRKAALKAHPLSAWPRLTPDSPDFWTNESGAEA